MAVVLTEQWLNLYNTDKLEKRTYQSGQVRWYICSFKKWRRIEDFTATRWVALKTFITPKEYIKSREDESTKMMLRYYLRKGQMIGSYNWKNRL